MSLDQVIRLLSGEVKIDFFFYIFWFFYDQGATIPKIMKIFQKLAELRGFEVKKTGFFSKHNFGDIVF